MTLSLSINAPVRGCCQAKGNCRSMEVGIENNLGFERSKYSKSLSNNPVFFFDVGLEVDVEGGGVDVLGFRRTFLIFS